MARFSLRMPTARFALGLIALISVSSSTALAQRTVKPVLHGEHWMAITGKPLAATAGALTFNCSSKKRSCSNSSACWRPWMRNSGG